VSFVTGDDDAVIRRGCRGNDHVDWAARAPDQSSFRNDSAPFERGVFVKCKDAISEQGRRPVRAGKPSLEITPSSASRSCQYAAPDLCQRKTGDKQLFNFLVFDPR
jgi:hypothetical protein